MVYDWLNVARSVDLTSFHSTLGGISRTEQNRTGAKIVAHMAVRYVCLLRGINVGGNHKVAMADLRAVFERMGFHDAMTYINSGNVIFSSDDMPVTTAIEIALAKAFGFAIPVLVIDAERVQAIAGAIPKNWQNNTLQKSDVLYLMPGIDMPGVVDTIGYKPEIETVMYVPGAVLCNIERTKQSRASLLKLMGTPIYKRMTIRNINTARKLAELCR